ncbi:restriction endonuclease subunit S [Methylomonas koyamae]|uniref:restriction endonuclease subunit S n=1 Tax=Methylomonas koyamae TaxID=702114 RepID=UPI001C33610B|nr:restriction endonuclease subunit S [Methylomonas koyamae]BBL56818.1 hypothetical protein MKFW12EY_04310 [Methylomonas koyamae]
MNTLAKKIPQTWETTTLGNVYQVVGGGTPSTEVPDYWDGNIPWVTSADIESVRQIKIRKYVSEKGIKESTTNKVPPKTLLVVTRVGLGKIAISETSICFSQDLQGLIQSPKIICPEYTLYLLSYKLQYLKFDGRGTTISGITKKQLTDLDFELPPLSEQHRIVAKIEALFSELDKGIESFKTAREQLKIYRQALLKHAFSGKLTEQWRAENAGKLESAETLLQRIQTERQQRYQQQLKDWEDKSPSIPLLQKGKPDSKHPKIPPFEKGGLGGISKPKAPKTLPPLTAEELAELPELPEGWVYSRLGALIDEPTYGTAKKCDYEVDGIGVLRIPNVVSGKINASDLKFAQFDADERASYKLDVGDILLIRSNGSISIVGKCALVSEQDINYLYAGYLIKLRPNQVLIASTYLVNQLAAHSLTGW